MAPCLWDGGMVNVAVGGGKVMSVRGHKSNWLGRAVMAIRLCICMTSFVMYSNTAAACGGPWDVACNVGKAIEKGAQDTGKTVEKAAQDTGKTVEKAGQDTGKTVEKAAQDTGHTLETAAHDTGHALEKAGQDVGHLLQQLINFHLACDLPRSKPSDLETPYKASCGSNFSTYRNDLDVCNGAGGASAVAAVAAGAAGVSAAATGGGTYVLAKVAFELCQKACRSQATLKQCVASVDQSAQASAGQATDAAKKNDDSEALLKLFSCMDDAYAGEKLLVMDSILNECESTKTCNTQSSAFSDAFIERTNEASHEIDLRRDQALASLRSGVVAKPDYGPYAAQVSLASISLAKPDDQSTMICRARQPELVTRLRVSDTALQTLKIRWVRESVTVLESEPTIDASTGVVTVPICLKGKGIGKWDLQVFTKNNLQLGSFGFVYRPDDQ
jgi:hypothetical protein